MNEFTEKVDTVATEIQQLDLNEKGTYATKKVKRQLGGLEMEKATSGDNTARCEFIYKRPHTNHAEGIKHNKGERCKNGAVSKPGNKYCYFHKWSSQAKKAEESRKNALKPYKEYYCNPDKELTLLYGDVYTDTTNMIVQKNSDPFSNIKWIAVCRSKVDQLGNRILHKLTKNTIEKLNDEIKTHNYNFIIKPKMFRKTVRDYSDCGSIHSPPNHIADKLHKGPILLFPKGMLDETYGKTIYKSEEHEFGIPYKELINESEYEEWFQ